MASMSDEKLWELIHRCDVPTLKSLLGKAGVPHNVNKLLLQRRMFYSIRLGLDVIPTQDEEDKEVAVSHRAKLDLGGGLLLPHPLTLDDWEEPPVGLPDIISADIENYYKTANKNVSVPTGGEKALTEGHSLYKSKHVEGVSFHNISHLLGICFIRGYVIPSMRVHADKYMVWVQLYKDSGAVRTADCHCIAGVGGMCKHIAALLYFVAKEVSAGRNKACTAQIQIWHKPSSSRMALKTSALLADIKTPKASRRVGPVDQARRDQFDPRPVACRGKKSLADFDLDALSSFTSGKAAVLLYANKYQPSTISSIPCPDINNVVSCVDVHTTAEVSPVMDCFRQVPSEDEFLKKVSICDVGLSNLEAATRCQSKCQLWHTQRKGRMTASVMHDVISHVSDGGDVVGELATVVENVMGYNATFYSNATAHGEQNEAFVQKKYQKVQGHHHANLKVSPSGLWVFKQFPLIAASPDGLVQCECCSRRLLEIKCPYRERFLTIEEYARQGTSITNAKHRTVIIIRDGGIVVNEYHRYYTQIQTQMLCTGYSSCDLAIATMSKENNFAVFNILKNEQFCLNVENKARVFFSKVIYPELNIKHYWLLKQQKVNKRRKTSEE